jgi:hypothetical protein
MKLKAQLLNENIMGYSRPRRQLVHENIVKLLSMAKNIESDYELWAS